MSKKGSQAWWDAGKINMSSQTLSVPEAGVSVLSREARMCHSRR